MKYCKNKYKTLPVEKNQHFKHMESTVILLWLLLVNEKKEKERNSDDQYWDSVNYVWCSPSVEYYGAFKSTTYSEGYKKK